jgi:AraC-like DNA-binding protein
MSTDEKMLERLTIISKLIYMQTRPKIDDLKKELLKTAQQKKAYEALDGKLSIKEIAKLAGYTDTSTLVTVLPLWESRGLVLSIGKATNKKYLSIENLEV